jgi:hypothetical protein
MLRQISWTEVSCCGTVWQLLFVLKFLAPGTDLTLKVVHLSEHDNKEQILLSEDVDLTRLVPLRQPVLDGNHAIPLNFLIFYINDELYTTERLHQALSGKLAPYTGEFFTLERDDVDEGDLPEEGTSTKSGAALTTASLRLKELRRDLEGTLNKAEVVRLQTAKKDKQAQIAMVRSECSFFVARDTV